MRESQNGSKKHGAEIRQADEAVSASSAQEMKKQIQALQRRIQEGRSKPMTDAELWEIDAQLRALKEVLLNDVKVQDPDCSDDEGYPVPGLRQVIDEQLSEILMDEFGADLRNFRRTQQEFGLKLSLLIEKRPEDAEDAPALDLIGFLAYKAWGPPSPGVSIGAVGVSSRHRGKGYGRQLMKVAEDRAALLGTQGPDGFVPGEVRLRSLATAVHFYERIGYERVEEGPDDKKAEKTPGCPDPETATREVANGDEEEPCVPMRRRCVPFSPRTSAKLAPLLSPKHAPWSPKQARALEDGPTWPRMADLILPG